MSKVWNIYLDESGSLSGKAKYFVISGIMYEEKYNKYVTFVIDKMVTNILKVIKKDELHCSSLTGKEEKYARDIIFYLLGQDEKIIPISYVIDLQNTYLLSSYNRLSFKYNKCIEWFYRDLRRHSVISGNDYINIFIDEITFSLEEAKNIATWLPKNFENINSVNLVNSKNDKTIQVCDLIANSFSKNGSFNKNGYQHKSLNCFFELFPKAHKEDYFL